MGNLQNHKAIPRDTSEISKVTTVSDWQLKLNNIFFYILDCLCEFVLGSSFWGQAKNLLILGLKSKYSYSEHENKQKRGGC